MKPHLTPKAVELYREAFRRSANAFTALVGGARELVAEDTAAPRPATSSSTISFDNRGSTRHARRAAPGPTLDHLRLLADEDPRAREMLELVEAREISTTQAMVRLGIRNQQTGHARLRSAWKNATPEERDAFLGEVLEDYPRR